MSDSYSSGSSSSTSTPVVVNTPQTNWGLQLSKMLSVLANNQYSWAMDQYNTGMGITSQNIAQYMQLSGEGAGLAQTLIKQYQDQFAPLVSQYLQQAASYNSEARQRFEMGRAESTVNQAYTSAMNEAERKLQSYGINLSGKYADLELAKRTERAAALAGAGTQAALDTADRGRAMLEKGIQFGQNVPGMAVNALNSAYTGVTGAQNAILGQMNAGANLATTAAPYYNAAASANKTPPVGNNSVGSSQQQSKSSSPDRSGAASRTGQPGKGMYDEPMRPSTDPMRGGSGAQGAVGANPYYGAARSGLPGTGGIAQIPQSIDWNKEFVDTQGGMLDQLGGAAENPDWGGGPQYDPNFNPESNPGGGEDTLDPNWEGTQGFEADPTFNPESNPGGGDEFYGDTGSQYDSSYDAGYYDPDMNPGGGDEFYDSSGGWGDTEYEEGGPVPRGASPSRGRRTDDVSARLNAGEYVIPKDVVAHKGTHFFNSLIDKSRRLRTGMGGPRPGAKMKPALPGRPNFVSR